MIHSDVISKVVLFASNTLVLAGELFPSIPRIVPQCARTLCSYSGMIALDQEKREYWKLHKDFQLAVKHWDMRGIVYTATKVALKAIDIFLLVGSFSIAVIALANPSLLGVYYRAVMPLASLTIYPMIAFDFIDYFQNEALSKELKKIEGEDQLKFCQAFETNILLRRQLSIYRLDALKKDGITFENLKNQVDASIELNRYSVALKIYGYACLWFNGRYPGALTQAVTSWSTQVLYTSYFIYDKYYAGRTSANN